jgi:hypothetical protein
VSQPVTCVQTVGLASRDAIDLDIFLGLHSTYQFHWTRYAVLNAVQTSRI